METIPHSRILISAPPGAGPDVVFDGPLCLSVLTSGTKWLQWWTGERRPDEATITEVHHLSLARLVEPIIKPVGATLQR